MVLQGRVFFEIHKWNEIKSKLYFSNEYQFTLFLCSMIIFKFTVWLVLSLHKIPLVHWKTARRYRGMVWMLWSYLGYKLRLNSVFHFFFIYIYRFSFTNKNNVTVRVINYGATITDILLPDKNGTVEDISLGFDSVQGSWNVGCSFLYYQNLRFIKFYNFVYYILMICIKNGTFKKMFWNGYC